MKPGRLVCAKAGSTLLALAVLVSSAIAGTPRTCGDSEKTCTATCAGAGSACYLRISQDASGSPTVAAPNLAGWKSGDSICVDPGADIFWFTLEDHSSFTVKFGSTHPFAGTPLGNQPVFKGKNGHPTHDTVRNDTSSPGCYEYSLKHCARGTPCKPADPKVIVKGAGLIPPDASRPSEHLPDK
jgi:hypothetical protein